MKRIIAYIKSQAAMLFAAVAVGAASLFALMTCNCPYYEPEHLAVKQYKFYRNLCNKKIYFFAKSVFSKK